ncbi:hypothetical protein GW17_00000967 [Ensete ventricosum]|nr:hypothetical protein GW17_00000967 [Ensete ventricosum]
MYHSYRAVQVEIANLVLLMLLQCRVMQCYKRYIVSVISVQMAYDVRVSLQSPGAYCNVLRGVAYPWSRDLVQSTTKGESFLLYDRHIGDIRYERNKRAKKPRILVLHKLKVEEGKKRRERKRRHIGLMSLEMRKGKLQTVEHHQVEKTVSPP